MRIADGGIEIRSGFMGAWGFKCALLIGAWMFMLAGCAGHQAFRQGEDLLADGEYDQAVVEYMRALSENPQKHEYKMKLLQAREKAALMHLAEGRRLVREDRLDDALLQFQMAEDLVPGMEAATQELEGVNRTLEALELTREAEGYIANKQYIRARRFLEQALKIEPAHQRALELQTEIQKGSRTLVDGFELDLTSDGPITLKLKDADLFDVFAILTKLSGINFIFDEELRPDKVDVFLENANFAQALEFILHMNELGKKVLNNRTIIIYPRSSEKDKKYEDQVVQVFFLSNIQAKKAVVMLRTVLQLRKIYLHEELNALVIRDRPEVLQVAQQIIEAADRADAEVVFDLELIEVSLGDDTSLGPQLSNYALSLGVANSRSDTIVSDTLSPGADTDNLVSSLGRLETFYTLPSATFDFAKTLTDTQLLANPKIRVKNKEKAKVHIGSREPVITVTINGDNRSDNVQYVDVGVKLNVEPDIRLDSTVVTKMNLEVSSISDRQPLESGTIVFTITTTNAESVLTLKDGQRTVIGGLIRDDQSTTKKTIPLLGDIPWLGKLFTHYDESKGKREILLSITPHVVKSLDVPFPDTATIWSGGEDDLKASPRFGTFADNFRPELERTRLAPAPAARRPDPSKELPWKPTDSDEPAEVPVVPMGALGAPQAALPGQQEQAPAVAVSAGRLAVLGPNRGYVDRQLALTVNMANVDLLHSASLTLAYDPEILEFVQAEEGDLLRRGGYQTSFQAEEATAGQVRLLLTRSEGAAGVMGSGVLCRLIFKVLASGKTEVTPQGLDFRDAAGLKVEIPTAGMNLETYRLPQKSSREGGSAMLAIGSAKPKEASTSPPDEALGEQVMQLASLGWPALSAPVPAGPKQPVPDVVDTQALAVLAVPAPVVPAEAPLSRFVVRFYPGQVKVRPEFHYRLAEAAEMIKSYPGRRIVVKGYSDSVGPTEYKLKVSTARAMSVESYLVGVFELAPERVSSLGLGEADPVGDNSSQKGRYLNRRAEVAVYDR